MRKTGIRPRPSCHSRESGVRRSLREHTSQMTRRAKQGYVIVFAPPNGCNEFCCTPGSNGAVYVIARITRDSIQNLDPRFRGDDGSRE